MTDTYQKIARPYDWRALDYLSGKYGSPNSHPTNADRPNAAAPIILQGNDLTITGTQAPYSGGNSRVTEFGSYFFAHLSGTAGVPAVGDNLMIMPTPAAPWIPGVTYTVSALLSNSAGQANDVCLGSRVIATSAASSSMNRATGTITIQPGEELAVINIKAKNITSQAVRLAELVAFAQGF